MSTKLGNVTYDRLKFFTLVVLPSSAAFYLGFGQTWNFPETEKVGTTIGLLAAFLGTLLQISNSQFKKESDGVIEYTGVDPDTGLPDLRLTVEPHAVMDPESMLKKGAARFKIKNSSDAPLKKMEIPEEAVEIEEH